MANMKKYLKNKFIKNGKKGFTLLELIITMLLIAIFFSMLAGISVAMTRAFSRTDEYTKAVTFRNFIYDEVRNKLNLTRRIKLAVPRNNSNNRELNTSDLSGNGTDIDLYEYNALFANYGKVYTISADRTRINQNITNIEDIEKKNIRILRENNKVDGRIIDFEYPKNHSLKGLVRMQEAVFINDSLDKNERIIDPYDGFNVDLTFSPLYKRDYSTGKDEISGIRIRIIVYKIDRKKVRRDYINEEEEIEIKNLGIENSSFETTDGANPNSEYRVLYFNIN